VEVCLEYLRRGGTDWSPHPARDEVRREYDRIWSVVGSRQIEGPVHSPLITNLGGMSNRIGPGFGTSESETAPRAQEALDQPGRFFERPRYRPRVVPYLAFITYLSINTYDFRGGWHGN
jgi:hypothetical protein